MSLPAFSIVSPTHIMCFKCVPDAEQGLSAVGGSVALRGMRSDSRWLACMELRPVRCGPANGVEE